MQRPGIWRDHDTVEQMKQPGALVGRVLSRDLSGCWLDFALQAYGVYSS